MLIFRRRQRFLNMANLDDDAHFYLVFINSRQKRTCSQAKKQSMKNAKHLR